MNQRVRDHIARFNTAQRSGEWAPFLAAFTEDAVMSFEGVPAKVPGAAPEASSTGGMREPPAPSLGPFHGRDAIAAAYEANPPTDTMSATSAETDGDTDRVRVAWDARGTGTIILRWRDSQLAALHITFD